MAAPRLGLVAVDDEIRREPTAHDVHQLVSDDGVGPLAPTGLGANAPDMGSDQYSGHLPQCVPGRQRVRVDDIKHST